MRVNPGLITDERIIVLAAPLCAANRRMDAVEDENTGMPIQRLGDCHYLISGDLVRINVGRLRRLIALTNRSFYPRDESATGRKSDAAIKMAGRDKRRA